MKASTLILSLGALLLALSGCASPCESVCASYNDCGLTERADDVDCPAFCGREQQFEETAAAQGGDTCQKEFEAHVSCWESNIANICDAKNTQCEASGKAWVDCMAKFCAVEANAKDQACVPQSEGPALPALRGF